ncbi:MAG: malate synthase G [Cocleimonas sp.]
MENYISVGGLKVAKSLYQLVTHEVIPELDNIEAGSFWASFEKMIDELAPQNKALLKKRETLQTSIDQWHLEHREKDFDFKNYKDFLIEIGYLLPEPNNCSITTKNVDIVIAKTAGAQLVVPINNARFALNATNARWGSLFDALYGTDVIAETVGLEKGIEFNPERGRVVIQTAFEFLDQAVPLVNTRYQDILTLTLLDNKQLQATLADGKTATLTNSSQFKGYTIQGEDLVLLLENNGLYIEIHINANHPAGKLHPSCINDVVIESALSTIQDCEDSVTAVTPDDKTLVYKSWLGLMRGDLKISFNKGGKETHRTLNPDRIYTGINGEALILTGRSLMLIRNVGHLMTNEAILTAAGEEIPEGILDGMITSLIALYDIQGKGIYQNSQTKSIYIVKPKMHGPEEVAFSVTLFSRIENILSLPKNTIKIGIMDEERRTTVNLKACIKVAKERVIFINTGFLDRTGDEIHTSMQAGAFLPKADIKKEPWISAYEDWNIDTGLMCGLQGKAQIGKGMWAMPDLMAQMLDEKIAHPKMGANSAWVPSPTAATLHAMHYHQINVTEQQNTLLIQLENGRRGKLDDILTIPLLHDKKLTAEEIQQELDNNAQGILGYVVRWIDQGIGCSKVPDIHNVGLMEDRATLRISSQHMANWLLHGLCKKEQVVETFKRMAMVVDEQNRNDPLYQTLAPDFTGIAFQASLDLVLKGVQQPSGYTEPILHAYRKRLINQH